MSARKLGASWWCDFRWQFTRYRRRSPLNTKGGAQAYEIMLRRELMQHGNLDRIEKPAIPMAAVPTFAEFSERWMREYVEVRNKPSEQRNKRNALRNHLLPALGSVRLRDISSAQIDMLIASLRNRGLCAKSVNNFMTVLRTCLACAGRWGMLDSVPAISLLRTEQPTYRFLSVEQLSILIARTTDERLRGMILLASQTGLRFCELIALRWEDVDLSARVIRVARSDVRGHVGSTKSNRIRYVPMTTAVGQLLCDHTQGAQLVFHRHGQSIRYTRSLEELQRACRHARVPVIGWHDLRHTFASHLIASGAHIRAAQGLLGHQSIAMTERYAHLSDGMLRSAIDLLDRAQIPLTGGTSGNRWAMTPIVRPREPRSTVPVSAAFLLN